MNPALLLLLLLLSALALCTPANYRAPVKAHNTDNVKIRPTILPRAAHDASICTDIIVPTPAVDNSTTIILPTAAGGTISIDFPVPTGADICADITVPTPTPVRSGIETVTGSMYPIYIPTAVSSGADVVAPTPVPSAAITDTALPTPTPTPTPPLPSPGPTDEQLKPPILTPGRILCSPRHKAPLIEDVRLAFAAFVPTCDHTAPPRVATRGCRILATHKDAVIAACGLSGARMRCEDVQTAVAELSNPDVCNNAGHVGGHLEFAWGMVMVSRDVAPAAAAAAKVPVGR